MTKKGREFNEIYDLTAMRVIVDSVKDCYGAVGRDPLAVEAAARAASRTSSRCPSSTCTSRCTRP